MGALYDGDCFLIGKYAVAIMPGRLSLTESNSAKLEDARPLLAGLTKSVHGNPSLPKVAEELKTIQGLYGGKQLLDEKFNIRNLEQELKNIPLYNRTYGNPWKIPGECQGILLVDL